jgi:hypothetical protein
MFAESGLIGLTSRFGKNCLIGWCGYRLVTARKTEINLRKISGYCELEEKQTRRYMSKLWLASQ